MRLLRILAPLVGLVLLPVPPAQPATVASVTVGFSFSAAAADPSRPAERQLDELMLKLHPDLVRLPVYWSQVAPTPIGFDFSALDRLWATVTAYDAKHRRQANVLLVIGARNLGYPEVYLPGWLGETEIRAAVTTSGYRSYLESTVARYRFEPHLYAWQIENEPLDNVSAGAVGDVSLGRQTVADEALFLRELDAVHPVVVTTYNSAALNLDEQVDSPLNWLYTLLPGPRPVGHPGQALDLGDALGLDVYVVTDTTPLQDADASRRIGWKADTLNYWASMASGRGKQLWVTEMQGFPWKNEPGFSTADLQSSAVAYRDQGARVFLLWGVESWLGSPDWMAAGVRAVRTLRHHP